MAKSSLALERATTGLSKARDTYAKLTNAAWRRTNWLVHACCKDGDVDPTGVGDEEGWRGAEEVGGCCCCWDALEGKPDAWEELRPDTDRDVGVTAVAEKVRLGDASN